MLYNADFLYLHYPKTAGKSVAVYFARNMAKPIYGRVADDQPAEIGLGPEDGVFLDPTGGHDNMITAPRRMRENGHDPDKLKAILIPIRNPFDMVASQYFFMRRVVREHPSFLERPAFRMAHEASFSEFCANCIQPDFAKGWLRGSDGTSPAPVELIRYEGLRDNLRNLLARYGLRETHPLPHLNKGDKTRQYRDLYDATAAEHIRRKCAAMFEAGGYDPDP